MPKSVPARESFAEGYQNGVVYLALRGDEETGNKEAAAHDN